jgi:hypothetical protein
MIGILEPPPYAVLSSAFVIPAFVYALSRPSVTSCCSFSFSTPHSYCTSGDTFCRSFRAGELADRVAPFQAETGFVGIPTSRSMASPQIWRFHFGSRAPYIQRQLPV